MKGRAEQKYENEFSQNLSREHAGHCRQTCLVEFPKQCKVFEDSTAADSDDDGKA